MFDYFVVDFGYQRDVQCFGSVQCCDDELFGMVVDCQWCEGCGGDCVDGGDIVGGFVVDGGVLFCYVCFFGCVVMVD